MFYIDSTSKKLRLFVNYIRREWNLWNDFEFWERQLAFLFRANATNATSYEFMTNWAV